MMSKLKTISLFTDIKAQNYYDSQALAKKCDCLKIRHLSYPVDGQLLRPISHHQHSNNARCFNLLPSLFHMAMLSSKRRNQEMGVMLNWKQFSDKAHQSANLLQLKMVSIELPF